MTTGNGQRPRINRITDTGKIREILEQAEGHELSRRQLLERINERWSPWSRDEFDRKLDTFIADGGCPIAAMPGDRVRFTGSEQGGGRTGSGLHNEVRDVLDRHGLRESVQGDRSVAITANRRSGDGEWTTPDLVMLHRPPQPTSIGSTRSRSNPCAASESGRCTRHTRTAGEPTSRGSSSTEGAGKTVEIRAAKRTGRRWRWRDCSASV
jgi:hypothetical protein